MIIALWSLCLLAIFAVSLGYNVRQKISLVQRLEERSKLRLIAEAGVERGIIQIKKEDPLKSYAALSDAWSNARDAFKDIGVGDGTFTVSYDYRDELSGLAGVQYGLIDEERKININKADLAVMARLFQIVLNSSDREAEDLAASIIDWRDSDSALTLAANEAEDPYYRNLSYPYEAKDAAFEVLEEVLLVKGMDEDLFARIKDYLTIYGSGKININTASRAVLLALGLSEDIADKIMEFRYGPDKAIATADDNFFSAPADIVPSLSQSCHLSDSEISELSRMVEQNLATNSDNFMIKSSAKLHNRENANEVTCVVDRSGKILSWRES